MSYNSVEDFDIPHCMQSHTICFPNDLFTLFTKLKTYPDSVCNTRPRGYKTFFMLNSAEHKISTPKILKYNDFSCCQTLSWCINPANKC